MGEEKSLWLEGIFLVDKPVLFHKKTLEQLAVCCLFVLGERLVNSKFTHAKKLQGKKDKTEAMNRHYM